MGLELESSREPWVEGVQQRRDTARCHTRELRSLERLLQGWVGVRHEAELRQTSEACSVPLGPASRQAEGPWA